MSLPLPQPYVQSLVPYAPGDSSVANVARIVKLSSNESPLGPSPRVVSAFTAAAPTLHRYPDGSHAKLRTAIGEQQGLDPDQIVCGAGSDELISLLIRAYAAPGDDIVYSAHGYLMYPIYAHGHGVRPIPAPEKELCLDVDAVLAAITPKTKLVFVANPNNPTGTYLPPEEIERLRNELREDVVLVLDAAYAEYVNRSDYADGRLLVSSTANTVMLRTFSKIYGLGGLRVGWGYFPPAVADALNRLRSPFNLSTPALEGAAAAIADLEFTALAKSHNDFWQPWLAQRLQEIGLETTPSVCNFLLIRFPSESGKTAMDADAFLRSRGVILRALDNYNLSDCLRATIGTDEENHIIVAALTEFLEA